MEEGKITVIREFRKTLSMRRAKEGIVVYVPFRCDDLTIERFVKKHRLWIERRLAEETHSCDISDGAVIPFMGENVVIREGRPKWENGILYLPQKSRRSYLEFLCRENAERRMKEMTKNIAETYGFRYADIRIGYAKTRWGTCTGDNRIRYTVYTAFLPDKLAYYLAVHELCHTRHHDHSRAFWKEVEAILPDWQVRRKEMKSYHWVFSLLDE